MGKNKLKKFAKNDAFEHVIQPKNEEVIGRHHPLRGRWQEHFGNDHPIVLELACGKGEYSVGMAKVYPDKNFIGIDIKGARMYTGAQQVADEGLKNVCFLRTKIDFLTSFFAPGEISEIWILFADPQPGKPRKRLTSPLFLNRYVQVLKSGGFLNLKSDSTELYEYTRDESINAFNGESTSWKFEQIANEDDLYGPTFLSWSEVEQRVLGIKTFYEQMWLAEGKRIKFLRYRLSAEYGQ